MVLFKVRVSWRLFPHPAMLAAARTSEAIKLISQSHRWRKTALASLVGVVFGLSGTNVSALALGRITVQSALGEPLRAEIDVPDINAEEAASLKTSVALPEAFRAAGLDYNAALAGAQISLQRRADGRAYIRLSSDKIVTEPFVDLILEASWASGRIVRDYTMLLDPPNIRAAVQVAPAAPQAVPAVQAPAVAITPTTSRPAVVSSRTPPAAASTSAPSAKARNEGETRVTVRPGDTASKIAAATKPAQVSLDQMLVALLRNNADAFVGGNLNRLKAGAALTIPSDDQARAMPAAEASQTVIAQSRDFNDFRGNLASNAPTVPVAAADRKASGNVLAQVEEKKPAVSAADKLKLSKGAVQAKAAEEKVTQEKIAQDAAKRKAELAKNIKDLNVIAAGSSAASAAASAAAPPAAPAIASAPIPSPVQVPAPAPLPVPSAAVVASAPPAPPPVALVASAAPVPVPAPVPPKPKQGLPDDPGMLDRVLENSLVSILAAALVALLVGLGIYRSRKRQKTADVDSAFLESRLQPDSFFGASGGQRVDTSDGAATGSSMVYSPSQLDAADDVDPVAEADVYLAYGRDLQAEEILKEALRTHSGRIAIHQKLLDIYAKRRDTQAFENMANEAYKLVGGQSPEWAKICEQGFTLDPANPLYKPGGQPSVQSQVQTAVPRDFPSLASASAATQRLTVPPSTASVSAPVDLDLDLDLDFSLDEAPASAIVEAQPTQIEPTLALQAVPSAPAPLDMEFGMTTEVLPARVGAADTKPAVELALPDLEMAIDTVALTASETENFRQQAEVSFGSTNPVPLQTSTSAMAPFNTVDAPLPHVNFGQTAPSALTASQAAFNTPEAADSGMLEFDLGTLSLELEPTQGAAIAQLASEPEDPLATKLALAEEFVSIGDDDGARALIEEVIAEAAGDLKTKAQRALSSLG